MDRIEALAESNNEQIQRNSELIEANAQQIAALTENQGTIERSINGVLEIIGLTAGQLNRLTERVDRIAAVSERYDRILDYLIQRNGEQPQEYLLKTAERMSDAYPL